MNKLLIITALTISLQSSVRSDFIPLHHQWSLEDRYMWWGGCYNYGARYLEEGRGCAYLPDWVIDSMPLSD